MRLWHLADETAMMDLARLLAPVLKNGMTVYLHGDLGAGKTTLVRGILRTLGHQGAVKSPTYTLVEPYELEGVTLNHFDLYRLADPEELEYMGIRDYFGSHALNLIEWPEKGQGVLPSADLHCYLEYENGGRRLTLESTSAELQRVIDRLALVAE